jgi:predicted ATPase
LFKLLFNNLAQKNGKEGFKNLEVSILKDIIDSFSNKIFSTINYYLNIYSPIEKIRISPDYKITKDTHNGRISLSNFYLEFRINETWINYGLLSDGTKRLFYILTELIDLNDEEIKGQEIYPIITLLEEPELGIHPHQLHKLMQFIKEQSEEKQIILTTHSPQVLDVLGPDELDRIIICYYDNEKGTQLRHLTEREMEKAKSYIQDEFLSDYWIHSDLEETN